MHEHKANLPCLGGMALRFMKMAVWLDHANLSTILALLFLCAVFINLSLYEG